MLAALDGTAEAERAGVSLPHQQMWSMQEALEQVAEAALVGKRLSTSTAQIKQSPQHLALAAMAYRVVAEALAVASESLHQASQTTTRQPLRQPQPKRVTAALASSLLPTSHKESK